MSKVHTPVAKTAIDAINAKLSALQNNYELIQDESHKAADECSKTGRRELYEKLLRQINPSASGIKRQTPLVNAGYAIRIATLSSTIAKFIEQKSIVPSVSGGCVNIVMLGCGLDVLGIWASSLAANINVYEIDCIDNCILKKDRLRAIGLIKDDQGDEDSQHDVRSNECDSLIMNGRIDLSIMYGVDEETSEKADDIRTYSLLTADLRNISSLSKAINVSSFNPKYPTIVVSELVIAYLGNHDEQLIQYIASSICTCDDSMFIAYEPVFPSNRDENDGRVIVSDNHSSVIHGYSAEYFGQFLSKLNRGEAEQQNETQTTKKSSQPSFGTFATSEINAENKLRRCSFDGMIDCTRMATALTYFDISRSTPPELFDEYAALNLHLYCYSIICATSSSFHLTDLVQICPWVKVETAIQGGRGFHWEKSFPSKGGEEVILTSIKKDYQEQVRSIFKASYSHLFEEYPSVKKLVKSALKTDLSMKGTMISKERGCKSDCVIWNKYSDHGGAFWVVIDKSDSLLGCIGVMKKDGKYSTHGLEASEYYEINRLAVRAEARGGGIGKILLDAVVYFVLQNTITYPVHIIAVTPKILGAANTLYSTNDFEMKEEKAIGKMLIRTYVKTYLERKDYL